MKMMDRDRKKESTSKVTFRFEGNPWHGYSSESVWAGEVSKNVFQIMNTPFFAMGVSLLDIVLTEKQDFQNVYSSTVKHSGHSTYRLIPQTKTAQAVLEEYWRKLEKLECTYERAELGYTLLAVDVPNPTKLERAYEIMQEGEDDGVWGFEEGHAFIPGRLS